MPIYEFKCNTCKKISEVFVKSNEMDKNVIYCPECGQDAKKIISGGSFVINGFSEKNGYASNGK